MAFDPSFVCARTAAGDAELALPALGLALGQRRVLTLLQDPTAADQLAQKFHLEPAKLERDLARLADLHLVELRGATIASPLAPAPAMAPATAPATATATAPATGTARATATVSMTPVVIGGSVRRTPAKALTAGTAALLVVAGIWYATRSTEPSNRPAPAAVVATLSPTTSAPANARTDVTADSPTEVPAGAAAAPARANEATSYVGVPATATVLRGNAPPQERRVEIRPGLSPLAVSVPPPAAVALPAPAAAPVAAPAAAPVTATVTAPAATAARQTTPPRSESVPVNMAPGTPAPISIAPGTPTPVPAATATAAPPAPASTAAATRAEPPPPVQLAAANPAPIPRPAAPAPVPAPLKAISREQPEFPKEAAADGLKSGTVTARLHVDARGKVTGVDIVNAQPPRVFDRAVRRALLQWQFEAPATGGNADVDVDIKFQRD